MKTASSNLQAHVALEVASLALLWKVTRRDGTVFGFTDHDRDLTIEGQVYLARSAFLSTAVTTSAGTQSDGLDVQGGFEDEAIAAQELKAGLFDYAEIELAVCNWAAPADGRIVLRRGTLGQTSWGDADFQADLRGLTDRLKQNIVEMTSPGCRAELGDARCTVDLVPLTVSGTVTSATSRRLFFDTARAEADGHFNGGKVTFTSGENDGLSMEIKLHASDGFELHLPMPFDIAPGDTYDMHPGCDKSLATCRDTYSNVVNFRGEPHLPGQDHVTQFKVPPQ